MTKEPKKPESEKAERTGLTFGEALEAMKKGMRCRRKNWNGKGMWVWMLWGTLDSSKRSPKFGLTPPGNLDGVPFSLFLLNDLHGTPEQMPCFVLRTATGVDVKGWLASQTDMCAEDWEQIA